MAVGSLPMDTDIFKTLLDSITVLPPKEAKGGQVIAERLITYGNSSNFIDKVRVVFAATTSVKGDLFAIPWESKFTASATSEELQKLKKLKMGALAGANILRLASKMLHDISRLDTVRRTKGEQRKFDDALWVSERVCLIAKANYLIEKEIEETERIVRKRHE